MTAAYIRQLLEHGIATQAEWRQICELAIQHLEALAPGDAGPATPPLAERLTDDTLDAAYEAFWSECDDVAGPPSEQTGPTLQKARSAMRAVLERQG